MSYLQLSVEDNSRSAKQVKKLGTASLLGGGSKHKMFEKISKHDVIIYDYRCTRFRFGPLNPTQIVPRLQFVADKEKVSMTEDGKKALITLAQGDMRKVSFC